MISEIGDQVSEYEYEVDGDLIEIHNDFLICPIYTPRYNKTIHDFVKKFAIEQNCIAADIHCARKAEPPDFKV
ncbi:MAG: hypothetical protein GY749_34375 [Desulfobacteraceae bacterium]|nr:hypothetical protein [Desulfobacteraceae bacterium]